MKLLAFLLSLLLITTTIYADIQDTYISSSWESQEINFGDSVDIIIGYPGIDVVYSLYCIEVPPNAIAATMYLYFTDVNMGMSDSAYVMFYIRSEWEENTVTWMTRPDVDTVPFGSGRIDEGWCSFDLTECISHWYYQDNYGIAMTCEEILNFGTSNSSENTYNTPYIEWEYNPVAVMSLSLGKIKATFN